MSAVTLDRANAASARASVERGCRKTSVTLTLRNEPPITCDGLEFFSIAGEAMVVHRTPRGKTWQVTEPVTGLMVNSGFSTRSEAMINAQQRVNRRPGCLNDAIRQHNATHEA